MIRHLRASLPVLLLGVLFLNSCSISGDDPIVVPFVEDEFYAELWEDFTPQGRQILLRLSTIEEVDCKNATIEYTFSRQGDNEQVLSIESIELPDNCEEGAAPARGAVNLGTLENAVYPLSLSLRDAVNGGGLIVVSDGQLRLSIERGAGVKPLRAATRRIPSNTLWGYFDTMGEGENAAVAEAFLMELQTITQPQILENGNYGYFSVHNDTDLRWQEGTDEANGSRLAFQFRIPDADGVAAIQSLLAEYRADYGEAIDISLFTTTGENW